VITEADLSKINKFLDHRDHPGLHNAKGYIAWLGHNKNPVAFRNIRVKELPQPTVTRGKKGTLISADLPRCCHECGSAWILDTPWEGVEEMLEAWKHYR
jgi:hypothetical protein